MPWLLNLIYLACSIVLCPYWAWNVLRGRNDVGGIGQRLCGRVPEPKSQQPLVWLHGASVGELMSLQPLIDRLQQQEPSLQIVVSTYTCDGWRLAEQIWPDLLRFCLPFDLSWSVRRALSTLNPCALVLSELELWPNLLMDAGLRQIPVAVVSCRMNDADIATYRRLNPLMHSALAAVRWWGAQTAEDADRIHSLSGTSDAVVDVTGSLKYDVTPSSRVRQQAAELRTRLACDETHTVVVGGSTHDPEERLLLDAYQRLKITHPQLRLVLVPRQPWRASQVADRVRRSGLSCDLFSEVRAPVGSPAPVTVIDSVGLLTATWMLADVGFVGGTLTSGRGGQNMIEPALLRVPICFGPHVWNFRQPAEGLLHAGGARQVQVVDDIVDVVSEWLRNPDSAAETAANAELFVRSQQGAAEQTVHALRNLMELPSSADSFHSGDRSIDSDSRRDSVNG